MVNREATASENVKKLINELVNATADLCRAQPGDAMLRANKALQTARAALESACAPREALFDEDDAAAIKAVCGRAEAADREWNAPATADARARVERLLARRTLPREAAQDDDQAFWNGLARQGVEYANASPGDYVSTLQGWSAAIVRIQAALLRLRNATDGDPYPNARSYPTYTPTVGDVKALVRRLRGERRVLVVGNADPGEIAADYWTAGAVADVIEDLLRIPFRSGESSGGPSGFPTEAEWAALGLAENELSQKAHGLGGCSDESLLLRAANALIGYRNRLRELGCKRVGDRNALDEAGPAGVDAENNEMQRLEDEAVTALAAWWEIATGDTELEDVARDFLRHRCHVHGSTTCPALRAEAADGWTAETAIRSLRRLSEAAGPDYERDARIVSEAIESR